MGLGGRWGTNDMVGKAEGIVYEPEFAQSCAVDVEVLLGVMYLSCAVTGIKGVVGGHIHMGGFALSVLSNFQKEGLEEIGVPCCSKE